MKFWFHFIYDYIYIGTHICKATHVKESFAFVLECNYLKCLRSYETIGVILDDRLVD
jgi:hypothetical protein